MNYDHIYVVLSNLNYVLPLCSCYIQILTLFGILGMIMVCSLMDICRNVDLFFSLFLLIFLAFLPSNIFLSSFNIFRFYTF